MFGGGNTTGIQTGNVYDQLNGGPAPYTAVATHVTTGCVSSLVSVPVQNIQDIPDLTVGNTPSSNCEPSLANGQASVLTVDGAPAPGTIYTYAWTGPASFPVNNGTNNANSNQLIRLQGGAGFDYTVLVTNRTNGCQSSALVNVPDARVIPVLSLTPVPTTICDPTIAGVAFDGQVSAAVNNIPSGNTLNDYFFDWSVGSDGNGVNVLSGLDIGTYSVTALHNPTGCISAPYSAQVTNSKVLPVLFMDQTPSQNCAGGAPDGVARVTNVLPIGRTYDYRWYNGTTITGTPAFIELNTTATTSNYLNVQGGLNGAALFQYIVEVTIRETGCINSGIIGVDDDSQLPLVTLSSVDNTNCVSPFNGTASVNTLSYRGSAVTAPYAGFTFTWASGGVVGPAPGDTYTALASGSYTITVTNIDDNCTSNPAQVSINDDLFIPPIDIVSIDQTSCDPSTPNGALTATIDETQIGGSTGTTAGYTFQWINDVTLASTLANQITGQRGNQTYTVNASRTLTGCTNTLVVTLDENITIPVVSATVTDLTVCVPPNGSISASAAPASTYDFFWYNGSDAVDENAVVAGASQAGPSSDYLSLVPGNYTVVAQDVNTKCLSNMVIRTVNDASPAIVIDINNVTLPTDCNATNSEMTATANGSTTGYSFDWYQNVPQPTNVMLGSINYFTNPPVYIPATTVATGFQVFGLQSNIYTLEVTDLNTGCKNYKPHSLPFQNSHAVIKITKTDSELCPYTIGNGSITIEIENPVAPPPPPGTDQTDYNVFLYQGNTLAPPLTTLLSPTNRTTEPVLPFLVSGTLAPGSYIVGVQETYSGSNCFIYQDVIIEALALDPVITLASDIIANTACDPLSFDGSIEINVDKDPNDPVTGLTYDIDMNADPNNAFPVVGVPAGNFSATNLGPGTYTFNVVASNGCTAARAYTILNNPVVSQFVAGNLNIFNALYCDPLLEENARATINGLSVIGGGPEVIADYEFRWDDVTNAIDNLFVAQGDALNSLTGGDEFINQVPLLTSGTVPPGTVKAGTYRVRATKTADASSTGGLGCTSAPFTFTIGKNTVNPQITLTPFGDSSCDPNFFEGQIQVDVITPSGPGNGGTYAYQWTPNGGPGQPVNTTANTGINDLFTDLNDGGYALTSTNEVTGCSVSLSTTILRAPPPVFTLTALPSALTNCGVFDGRIDNIQVFINGAPGTLTDFDYTWFAGNLSTLVIDGQDDIVHPVDTELSLATFPSITLGSYFVKAIRKAGGAGVGCESAPVKRDILDNRIFPQLALTQIENSSCDGNFDGQITVTASTVSGPGAGANYDFIWTNDPDGAGPLFSASDALNQASPYSTPNTDLIGPGSYTVQVSNVVTACSTSGTIVLQQNDAVILIVDASKTNQEICDFDGSILVEEVRINGVVDPNHTNFNFTWFDANNTSILGPAQGTDSLTVNNYPTMGAGTYFVVAERLNGLSGSGCASAPFRVDIQDVSVNPIPSLQPLPLANSSCTGAFLNGAITIRVNENSGPGVGALYDYEFTYTGATPPLTPPPFLFTGNNGNGINDGDQDILGNLGTGSYAFTIQNQVTRCITPAQVSISFDPVASIPNIVTVDKSFPIDCLGNGGEASVTSIRIGSGPTITGAGLNPPVFRYDWYDNANDPFISPPPAGNVTPVIPDGPQVVSLRAGSYYVTVRDLLTDCKSTPTLVVIDSANIIYPSVVIQQTVLQLSCDPNDGTAELRALADGFDQTNLNYTFTWFNSLDGTGTTVIDPWPGSLSTITDLSSGNYSVSVLSPVVQQQSCLLFHRLIPNSSRT